MAATHDCEGEIVTVLRNLRVLHIAMKAAQQARAQFPWVHNGERFRVVFITDDPDVPSRMVLFFTHSSGQLSFEKPVAVLSGGAYAIHAGFQNQPGVFDALRRLFNTGAGSGRGLEPTKLFEEFDRATPTSLYLVKRPEPHEGPPRENVDEAEKIYFCGWQTYQPGGRRPTEGNLLKTQRLCGEIAYQRCVKSHISSCWSDQPGRAVPYADPQ